ncbi:MAG: hypothetical protein PUD93_10655 [Lachnospiraceae bacterium]|nr:hypothetical protein [Lachnospiraceae bacterium]
MKKKVLSVIMASVVVLTLAACGSSSEVAATSEETVVEEQEVAATTEPEETVVEESEDFTIIERIDEFTPYRFCEMEMLNLILSHFARLCEFKGKLMFSVDNSCDDKLQVEGNRPKINKAGHGYGTLQFRQLDGICIGFIQSLK